MKTYRPPNTKKSMTVQCNDSVSQTLKHRRHHPTQQNPNHLALQHKSGNTKTKSKRSEEAGQQPDLSSSYLHPPSILVKRSIKRVEAWLEACERAETSSVRNDTASMISLWGKGVVERPALDVPLMRTVGWWSEKLSLKSRSKTSSSKSRKEFKPPRVKDCVYEKGKWALKWELVEEMGKGAGEEVISGFGKLLSFFGQKNKLRNEDRKMAGFFRKHRPTWREEEDPRFFMSGGRSPGISASHEIVAPWDGNESGKKASDTESDVDHCLCRDDAGHSSPSESDVEQADYKDKSKPSSNSRGPVKLSNNKGESYRSRLSARTYDRELEGDDIIRQNLIHTKDNPKLTSPCLQSGLASTPIMSSPGSNYSRASSFNMGSIIELSISAKQLEEREKRERLENGKDRTPSPVPFRPNMPRPIQTERVRSWASIPLRRKPSIENFKPTANESARNAFTSPPKPTMAAQPNPIIPVRKPGPYFKEQIAMPGVMGQGTRAFMDNREKRADRNTGGVGALGGGQGQQTDIDKEMDVFRSNWERRRAERRSAGQLLEVGTVGGMTSRGAANGAAAAGQKKRVASEGKKPFNVDDEPVASGYEWERRMREEQSLAKRLDVDEEQAASESTLERRMKKGQPFAKKSPAEKYREEERAKYWSPK